VASEGEFDGSAVSLCAVALAGASGVDVAADGSADAVGASTTDDCGIVVIPWHPASSSAANSSSAKIALTGRAVCINDMRTLSI
jgi:hypothetical protein